MGGVTAAGASGVIDDAWPAIGVSMVGATGLIGDTAFGFL